MPSAFQVELPQDWQALVFASLSSNENVLAALEVDLNSRLCFTKGLLLATPKRLLSWSLPEGVDPQGLEDLKASSLQLETYPMESLVRLKHIDFAGVGTLELVNEERCLAKWRFTLANNVQALALQLAWNHALEQHLTPKLEVSQGDLNGSLGMGKINPLSEHDEQFSHLLESPEGHRTPSASSNDVEEAPASTWGLLRLWRFAKPYQTRLLAGFLLTLASTAATLVPPYLTMPLMDKILIPFQNGKPIDFDQVATYLLGLLAAALLAWSLGWLKTYILALVSERIGADLRTSAYDHLMKLSLEYFGGRRTGDLMTRIGGETDRICVFLSLHLLDFATDFLMIVMTAIILFTIDPYLAMVTLLPLPFIYWLIHVVRDRLRLGFEKIDRVWSELTNVLADTIPGIRVVKAFAQEGRESARFREANKHNLAVNDRINFLWSLFSPTVTLMTEVGLLIVWAFGIWQVAQHQVTVGVLTAFLAYIGRFYTRLDSMSRIVSHTQKAAAGTKRIFEILDHVSSVPEPTDPLKVQNIQGEIKLSHAAFRYGNRLVIKDLSLTIKPGEMIGLVGQSGSGKSTLVNLICRFYDLSEGSVELDGVDIRRFMLADYRAHIGLVLQEPFLFFGTIADNISYGRSDASRSEIISAARAAHAHEFILRLPQGYDSLVGERGQGLSGGERQRISIARALLINPKILIMDEATSSVDTETEQEIQKALDNLVKGRTTIAIAHRLSTLKRADRLVVMEQGEKVEEGSHDELMARQGAYWRLYQAQAHQAELGLPLSAPQSAYDQGMI
jgi:ATP-binding cassette subfamily B protein